MLRSIKSLHGCTVAAVDGDIGHVEQAYFDDEKWGVRYLVVKTGSWFDGLHVLISPYSIRAFDRRSSAIHVDLSLQQVKDSPDIDAHKPVSRQHELDYLAYYNYPVYWNGLSLWGMGPYPVVDQREPVKRASAVYGRAAAKAAHGAAPPDDIHLRSTTAVHGYHIEGSDGSMGHVCGYLFDDVSWVIRYLIVDVRNWLPGGREVLLSTSSVQSIDWAASTVVTVLTRAAIRGSRRYGESTVVDHDYEATRREWAS
ncbi:PRC-barrel domain-containing protein [Cupriavidus sp. 30B13]|uniref:PRC-barrel domain-containing protein n=1 Tax=Cupriavidus sp. 30B13 TaxID=3384241 RepID=UPI003B90D354